MDNQGGTDRRGLFRLLGAGALTALLGRAAAQEGTPPVVDTTQRAIAKGAQRLAAQPNSVVIAGDSIASRTYDPNGYGFYSYWGPFTWAQVASGHRLQLLNNAGISGDTAAGLLARFGTDVLAYRPGVCVFIVGTNDMAAGVAATAYMASMDAMFNACSAAGIRVIACTIPPRASLTTAQLGQRELANAMLKARAATDPNVVIADQNLYIEDPATAQYATGMDGPGGDAGLHPSMDGAVRWGALAIAPAIQSVAPELYLLGRSNVDAQNVVTNPMFDGDAGTGLATDWTLALNGGTATTSKVAATDRHQEDWQQIDVTAAGTPVTITLNKPSSYPVLAGDKIYAAVEFENDGNVAGSAALELACGTNDPSAGGTGQRIGRDVYTWGGNGASWLPASGVLLTPVRTAAINYATSGGYAAYIQIGVSGTGTWRFRRAFFGRTPLDWV